MFKNKQMKVLIVSNMYPSEQKPYSGIFVLNQYNFLKEILKVDVELFAMKRTFTSKIGSILKYIKAFCSFTKHYFKKYDVIHVHYFYPLIILAVFYKVVRPKTKIVVTFHGSDITNFMNGRISKFIFKKILSKCNIIISVGQDLSDTILNKLGRKSDYVLSAGVDNNVFYKLKDISKKYDFIFVGSFIKRKGVDLLIKAIKEINNKSIKFCFVGSGEFNNQILDLKKEFNVEVLHNKNQQDLRVLYNESRFFIIPSRDEPFGLVATEAMFCGTPAIVSNSGGLKAQVTNKNNGFVFENESMNQLIDTIKIAYSLNENDYQVMAFNALNSNKIHSLENICKEMINIYQSK
jgi:L-malate glycosyltransferase